MEKLNLENKILEKIKADKLQPTSWWYFLIKDYSLWLLMLLSIVFSSLSIAPIIFILQNLEFDYLKHLTDNSLKFILEMLPYSFIMLSILCIYFASKAWQQTKNGYKIQGKNILIISILLSLSFGIVLNLFRFGKIVDDQVDFTTGGLYKSTMSHRNENWFAPEKGRIMGVVGNVGTSSFSLSNIKNKFQQEFYYDDDLPGAEFIAEGNTLRVIGFQNQKYNYFEPCAIFPNTLLTNLQRQIFQDDIMQKLLASPECAEILNKGRANFRK